MTLTIGILTGGGDCPGLNAAIRAVVRSGISRGARVIGIHNGWQGLVDGDIKPLTEHSVSGIISWGGTILGTSRTDPVKTTAGFEAIKRTIATSKIDALVVIGGDGTLRAAHEVALRGVPLVGIPKTIDNDIAGTDVTIGFDTAVSIVTEALDRLHTTAESHHRIMVVEVMGRNAGWIALTAGIAGGADAILIPEVHMTMDELCRNLKVRYDSGKKFSVVVVAEGTHHEDITSSLVPVCDRDECGHEKFVGVGNVLGKDLERRLAIETRVTTLGHVQRGGTPTAFDRVIATRMGEFAVDQIYMKNFGCMIAVQGRQMAAVSLEEVVHRSKRVDPVLYEQAKSMMDGRISP
ncbi:MAG: ATP-dependent 6-phosphofructokinase [Methanoregula sp.]|jgi:6-phosphofructokinase 1